MLSKLDANYKNSKKSINFMENCLDSYSEEEKKEDRRLSFEELSKICDEWLNIESIYLEKF